MDPPSSDVDRHVDVPTTFDADRNRQEGTDPSRNDTWLHNGRTNAQEVERSVHTDDDISIDWDAPPQPTTDPQVELFNVETEATNVSEGPEFSATVDDNAARNDLRATASYKALNTVQLPAITSEYRDATEQGVTGLNDAHANGMNIDVTEDATDRTDNGQQQHAAEHKVTDDAPVLAHRVPTAEEVYPGAPVKRVVLVPNGDLIIRTIQFDYTRLLDKASGTWPIVMIGELQVSRSIVKAASKLLASRSVDPLNNVMELKGDLCKVIGLWLRVVHNVSVPEVFPVDMIELRHVVVTGERYAFDRQALRAWYATWFSKCRIDRKTGPCLLYPSYALDHAETFASLTKDMVYRTAHHIDDDQPDGLRRDRYTPSWLDWKLRSQFVSHRIIGALNAARGRLRTVLTNGILQPINELLDSHCNCKAETNFAYLKALKVCRVWPLEESFRKNSIATILKDLSHFNFLGPYIDPCERCDQPWNSMIMGTVEHLKDHFNGLCLDCMNETTVARHYPGYQKQGSRNKFSGSCRIHHGDCSRYHSEMARKDSRYDRSGRNDRHNADQHTPAFDIMEEDDLGLSGLFNTEDTGRMDTSANLTKVAPHSSTGKGAFAIDEGEDLIDLGDDRPAKRRPIVDDIRRAGLNESTFTTPTPATRPQKRGYTDDEMDVDETAGAKRPRIGSTNTTPITPRGRRGSRRGSRRSGRGRGSTQNRGWVQGSDLLTVDARKTV